MRTPDISGRLGAFIAAQHDKKAEAPLRRGAWWKVGGGSMLVMAALYVTIDELQHLEWGADRLSVAGSLPYLLGLVCAGLAMLAVGVHRGSREP